MDKVTVVTVCYNAETVIESTMRSVCMQDYPDLEYLVIDGASEDKTNKIARTVSNEFQENKSHQIRIISEKDKGIYDAMNKGIDLATGEWIIFMNAGDEFPDPDTISTVFSHFDSFKMMNGVYGDTVRVRDGKEVFVEGRPLAEIKDGFPLPFCHQSIFVRRSLLQKFHFDLRYRQAGDYNFFVQAYLDGNEFYHVNVVVSRYLMGGLSEINNVKHWAEKIQIREENKLEEFSEFKKKRILGKYTIRRIVKQMLPKKILRYLLDR